MSGYGEYVSVDDDKISLDSMLKETKDTITYVRNYADSLRSSLDNQLLMMHSAINDIYTPQNINIPSDAQSVDKPSIPVSNIGNITLDNDWPDTNISNPNLVDFGNYDFTFHVPEPLVEIDETFSWAPENYTSSMWQTLFSKVHTAILDGSYSFPPHVFNALVNSEQESRRLSQNREFRSGLNAVGAMGWNIPSGHMTAFVSEFQSEVLKRDQDALNNITAKNFEIANANQQFFITAGVDVDKLERATFDSISNRNLDALKAAKEYLVRFREANIKILLAKYEGEKTRIEGIRAEVDAISARNESEVKVFMGRAAVIESQIKAIASKNQAMVDNRNADVELYKAQVKAATDEYAVIIEKFKVDQQAILGKLEAQIKIREIDANTHFKKVDLAKEIALAKANIASQGIASALGAINTSLSNTYSGSEQRSEGWQHSDSINETHDFAED